MAKFITIGYGDRSGYDQTSENLRSRAHESDRKLRDQGALIGIAGKPVQVRNTQNIKLTTTDAPFMSSALPVAGFAVIEAENLSDAISMVGETPCAIAYGVVEVWPIETMQ